MVWTCVACSTQYAAGLDACPHCGTSEYEIEGAPGFRQAPSFITVNCTSCSSGPWTIRVHKAMPGLIEIPTLFCASCGSQVQVPWPPVEDSMPKITIEGGPSNARDEAPSPVADASEPLVGAEADQGHPEPEAVLVDEPGPELIEIPFATGGPLSVEGDSVPALLTNSESVLKAEDVAAVEKSGDEYEDMNLADLRATADAKGLPSYGTKAQLKDRLREAE